MSMKDFSSIGDVIGEVLKETDEVCEIHGIKKVTAFGQTPSCLECLREKNEKETNQMRKEMTDNHYKRNTYDWLEKKSIFLDKSLEQATFENFDTVDKETAENKEKALNIAREYYKGATYNTVLTGKAGTGKSHLSMAMLKIVNEHSDPYRKCLFISIDELMRRIKDSFNNPESQHTEQRMTEMLTKSDLLVIDDLGAETGAITSDKAATDFTTRTLYSIVNGRMKKPTIITTNLSGADLTKKYDSKLISRMLRGTKGHTIQFKETNDKRLDLDF